MIDFDKRKFYGNKLGEKISLSPNIHDWNNTVFINFEHEAKTHNCEFQVGKNKLIEDEKINCFYELERVNNNMRKGKYKFKGSETFGKDNKFNLNSFVNK